MKRPFYQLSSEETLAALDSTLLGLRLSEIKERQLKYGLNRPTSQKPVTIFELFLRQIRSPLIYILVFAAVIAASLGDWGDAGFILVIILINTLIGLSQEYGAEKGARSLIHLTPDRATAIRNGITQSISALDLVPGDIVTLESGQKVPADLRLLRTSSLEVSEALLTGESLPVEKDSSLFFTDLLSIADQANMAFAGSIVTKGRATGVVTTTGQNTELGKIAHSIAFEASAKPPLIQRMEQFTKKIGIFFVGVTLLIGLYLIFIQQQAIGDVLIFSVALAVSAIPEGLAISMTVALAMASRRMGKKNVLVRKLPAVEALGSCTYIATDKTGTLTVNQLTIKKVFLPSQISPNFHELEIAGSGLEISPHQIHLPTHHSNELISDIYRFARTGALCSEGQLTPHDSKWTAIGDAVDIAFLALEQKVKLEFLMSENTSAALIESIPFEPEHKFAATLHKVEEGYLISIKGAFESLTPMCTDIDLSKVIEQAEHMASQGYRVLALCSKIITTKPHNLKNELHGLKFLGLAGMIDPLRPEAKQAIETSRAAGIQVAMITGDHPKTALAIAQELSLAHSMDEVVSGQTLSLLTEKEFDHKIKNSRVFARVEPAQKLKIVQTLIKMGHFVAVTGDGANDAPALKAANVGVAMGLSGTDIAKETADLVITDDRFASIQSGIKEGRIAYSNIRKVIYLLVASGMGEITLFILAIIFGTPMPLTAVQILWLNIVTNGIQDKGLALEPGEGDELTRPPRPPNEPIFDKPMIHRIGLSALTMGGVSFYYFKYLIQSGVSLVVAQNLVLLLMVLFENIMVGNCRSETRSAFKTHPTKNSPLILAALLAQAVHIASMYIPWLQTILGTQPVSFHEWILLLSMALSVLFVIEIYKFMMRQKLAPAQR